MKQGNRDLWLIVIGVVLTTGLVVALALATSLVTFYANHGGGQ